MLQDETFAHGLAAYLVGVPFLMENELSRIRVIVVCLSFARQKLDKRDPNIRSILSEAVPAAAAVDMDSEM